MQDQSTTTIQEEKVRLEVTKLKVEIDSIRRRDKRQLATVVSVVIGIAVSLVTMGSAIFDLNHRNRQLAAEAELRARALRNEAYVAFLTATEKARVANRQDTDDATRRRLNTEFEIEAGAALKRIVIFGDNEVINAIAEYSRMIRLHSDRCDKDTWEANIAFYERMRHFSLGKPVDIDPSELAELALFCTPSE